MSGILRAIAAASLLLLAQGPLALAMPWSDPSHQIVNEGNTALPEGSFTVVTFNMLHGYGSRTNDATLEGRLALGLRPRRRARTDRSCGR